MFNPRFDAPKGDGVDGTEVGTLAVAGFPRAPFMPGPNWFRLELLASRNFVPHGSVETHYLVSPALRGNALNDPDRRPIMVYLPERYRKFPHERFPVIYLLHGAMTDLGAWLQRDGNPKSLLETMDSVIGEHGDAILVMIDAWTSIGGSQYLNSDAIGRYQDYVVDDVVDWVDATFRTIRSASGRAIFGHSSGGFGAWMACTRRPGRFGVLGMLAADCLFEGVYLKTLGPAVRRLRDVYKGDMQYFWSTHGSAESGGEHGTRIYQPQDGHGHRWDPEDAAIYDQHMLAGAFAGTDKVPRYLFEPVTGRIDEEVWATWAALDPARTADAFTQELAQLKHISVGAAMQDEFFADNGAAALSAVLTREGVQHVHLTGDGTHEPGELFRAQFEVVLRSTLGL